MRKALETTVMKPPLPLFLQRALRLCSPNHVRTMLAGRSHEQPPLTVRDHTLLWGRPVAGPSLTC